MTPNSQHRPTRAVQSRRWLINDFQVGGQPARPRQPRPEPARTNVAAHTRTTYVDGITTRPPRQQARPGVHAVVQAALQEPVQPAPTSAAPASAPRRSAAPRPAARTQQPRTAPARAQTAKPASSPKATRSWRSRQTLIIALAVIIFALGTTVSIWGMRTNSAVQARVTELSSTEDDAPPATDKPGEQELRAHVVAPNMPRYLIIEKLGVKARVQTLGLTKDGAVRAPANVHDVGWYSGSSLPGVVGGATFMDGHVSSWDTDGVFKRLPKLAAGDELKIEMGDGRVLIYRVVKTQASAAESVDMAAALLPVTPGKSGLNLMTCHGQVKSGTDEFTERYMVFAEQI